jgi:phosphatidylglycerol:prolipoprotein diacylglycerol transferase
MVKLPRSFIAKFIYGSIFIILLPLFLFLWALNLDKAVDLLVPNWGPVAIGSMVLGGYLMVKGMLDLWIMGKGLPMSIFPPKNFVTRGIYAWFSHPIYFGAGLLSFGSSLWFHSPGGLYIVTPVLILAMFSLVYGFEHFTVQQNFGESVSEYHPIFSVPASSRKYRRLVITIIIFVSILIYLSTLLFFWGFNVIDNAFLFGLINLAILFLIINYAAIWNGLKGFSEWVANSRQDWLFFKGKFRIINHSIYSGMAATLGVGIFGYIVGNSFAALILTVCVILGSGIFAQFRWGSASLLRPFGYWGAILGGILGMILIRILFDISLYQAAIAGVLCAPFAQAIGRLRCLSQGCCHGIITGKELGIRVWQSQSRVVVFSGLKDKYLHPTQLYSILFNLLLGLLLFSVWSSHKFNGSLIVGSYFILTGIERFAEDAYRGEKQTRLATGLKENQWIAILALVVGIIITAMPFPSSIKALGEFNLVFCGTALLCGLIAAFAMSMDFPGSNVRFSRLSG